MGIAWARVVCEICGEGVWPGDLRSHGRGAEAIDSGNLAVCRSEPDGEVPWLLMPRIGIQISGSLGGTPRGSRSGFGAGAS